MEQFEKKGTKQKESSYSIAKQVKKKCRKIKENKEKELSKNRVSVNKIKVEYNINRRLKIIDLISIIFHQKVKLENLNLFCTMRKWFNIDILPLFYYKKGVLDSPQKSRHKKQNIYLNLYTPSFSDGESILLAE